MSFTKHNVCRGVVYHGDCLEVMKSMPDSSVGTIITSPPYNIVPKYKSPNCVKGKWRYAVLFKEGYDGFEDRMERPDYIAWQRACVGEMTRILKPEAALFYNHTHRTVAGVLDTHRDIVDGFCVRQEIIWNKGGTVNWVPGHFPKLHEIIYYISKTYDSEINLDRETKNRMGTIWKIQREGKNSHPAPFPVGLPRTCFKAVPVPPVFDPFLGSGTTGIAAELENLPWIGIEQSKKYVDISIKRELDKIRMEK